MKMKRCFVIMPFGKMGTEEFTRNRKIYQLMIKPTVEECGYEVVRADELEHMGSITRDIIEFLYMADLVIADLSGKNANVYYELGVRHTLFKAGTIIIIREGETLPFDIATYRAIFYTSELDGPELFRGELKQRIKAFEKSKNLKADNPVHDILADNFYIQKKENISTSYKTEHLQFDFSNLSNEIDELKNRIFDISASLNKIQESISDKLQNKKVKADIPKDNKKVFVSYAWGGESEKIVDQIERNFKGRDISFIRDKKDLGFKGSIKKFMDNLGQGKYIIIVIDKKYLESENCMYELIQISKNKNFYHRIFPIILEDANIYRSIDRIKYVKYWEDQIRELDKAMKEVSSANLKGFREEIDEYSEIRNTIAELTDILKDMNTLSPDMHKSNEFEQIINNRESMITIK